MATLYRKYRSLYFRDIIGQEPIVTTLTNQIKLDRIGHAYLFTGSRGVGKTSCARIFARAVNCLHPVDGNPCGECEVCKKLAADNVDIIEMDAASNNGVDDARDIREKVKYLPVSCKYKVYIIDEVHMLTGGAFNALLKTIEEPPEHVIFILATTEPQKLPQTILSRCIRFDFRLVAPDVLAKHIAYVYDQEGIKYTAEAVEEIARLGEGSVRDALSVADTLASAAREITLDVVLALTGAGETDAISKLFDCVGASDLANALCALDALVKKGKSMPAVCRQLIDYARNVLVCKSVGVQKATNLINADKATLQSIAASAERLSMQRIAQILTELGACENGLKYSVNPRVFLETSLVKLICEAQRRDDLEKRIAALENSVNSTEQKKNNVTPVRQAPPVYEPPESDFVPPQDNDFIAPIKDIEPPPQSDIPPARDIPPVPPPAKAPATPKRQKVAPTVKSADEGEFGHLKSTAESGLELLGKVVRLLRKGNTREQARVLSILSRDVRLKELADTVAVIAPDDVFLLLTEPQTLAVIDEALTAMGVNKKAKPERTADDLRREDIEKCKQLFGEDGVRVKNPK